MKTSAAHSAITRITRLGCPPFDNASVTTYIVENLAPGTYEFVATAYNAAGVESGYSNIATRVLP